MKKFVDWYNSLSTFLKVLFLLGVHLVWGAIVSIGNVSGGIAYLFGYIMAAFNYYVIKCGTSLKVDKPLDEDENSQYNIRKGEK